MSTDVSEISETTNIDSISVEAFTETPAEEETESLPTLETLQTIISPEHQLKLILNRGGSKK